MILLPAATCLNLKDLEEISAQDWERERLVGALVLFFVFLNMGGFPPLPGFFLKLKILSLIAAGQGALVAFVFIMLSVGLVYVYLRRSFKLLGLFGRGPQGVVGGSLMVP